MVNLQISDELDIVLEDAASRAGQSKDQFAQEILSAHLEDESLPLAAFSDEQLARLKQSVAQLEQGKRIPSEEVDHFFEEWFKECDAR